jgi:hypothetical protein
MAASVRNILEKPRTAVFFSVIEDKHKYDVKYCSNVPMCFEIVLKINA